MLDVLRQDGVEARQQLALHGLTQAVRTGAASYATVAGYDAAALREDETYSRALFAEASDSGSYIGAGVATLPDLADARRVIIHSDGAGALAAAIVAARPQVEVTIVASPAQAAWLRDDLPATIPDRERRRRVNVATGAPGRDAWSSEGDRAGADVVLTTHTLARYPDAEATRLLREMAGSLVPQGRVLLIEDTFEDGDPDEPDAEADLVNLALYGSGHRTDAELDALIDGAGLSCIRAQSIGWVTLRVLAAA